MNAPRALRRSRNERWVAGVMGGLAKFFDLSPEGLRVAYVLLSIFSAAFPGLIVYIVLWLVIPLED